MQTFLPYESFAESAAVLDRQRLGKQRVEGLQIVRTLAGITKGWANHPAVKMWRGHEFVLVEYTIAMSIEWMNRGYKDTCADKVALLVSEFGDSFGKDQPSWIGNVELHKSHQSNLLRKDPDYYSQFFNVPNDLDYYWPVN